MGKLTPTIVVNLIDIFIQNIFPILVVAGLGAIVRWKLQLEKKTLSKLSLYLLSPCLIFSILLHSTLEAKVIGQLLIFCVGLVALMGVLAWGLGTFLHLERKEMVAFILVVIFANTGNFGMTINQIRYGDVGLAYAAMYTIMTTVLIYTVGILLVSAGEAGWRTSWQRLWQMPAFYALIAAFVVYALPITMPASLLHGIEIAGNAAIPIMLLVLGMQMADLRSLSALRVALPAVGLRLLISPFIGLGLVWLLKLEGIGSHVALLQAGMPTAVVTIILATEFDTFPEAVTSVVILSTLLSPVTVTLLISLLHL